MEGPGIEMQTAWRQAQHRLEGSSLLNLCTGSSPGPGWAPTPLTCETRGYLQLSLKDHPENIGLEPDFQDPVSTISVFGLNGPPEVSQLLIRVCLGRHCSLSPGRVSI